MCIDYPEGIDKSEIIAYKVMYKNGDSYLPIFAASDRRKALSLNQKSYASSRYWLYGAYYPASFHAIKRLKLALELLNQIVNEKRWNVDYRTGLVIVMVRLTGRLIVSSMPKLEEINQVAGTEMEILQEIQL